MLMVMLKKDLKKGKSEAQLLLIRGRTGLCFQKVTVGKGRKEERMMCSFEEVDSIDPIQIQIMMKGLGEVTQ